MSRQLTTHISMYTDDTEIQHVIDSSSHLKLIFSQKVICESNQCIVMPQVERKADYAINQFNLNIFIRHAIKTDLGQLELYVVEDFIRQKVNVGPLLHVIYMNNGVQVSQTADHIKKQIQFLQHPANLSLPVMPQQVFQ